MNLGAEIRHFIRMLRSDLAAIGERLENAIQNFVSAIGDAARREAGEQPSVDKQIKRVRAVVSFDNETIQQTQAQQDKQYAVQNGIRKATWAAVFAASIYAAFAGWQVYETRSEFVVSQRPWVEVGTNIGFEHPNYIGPGKLTPVLPDIPIFPNFPITFVIVGKNYGRTPALHAYSEIEQLWVGTSPYKNIAAPEYEHCRASYPFSDKWSEAEFPGGIYQYRSLAMMFPDDVLKKWLSFRTALVVHGCIRYKDFSNLKKTGFHQTDFCDYFSLETPHTWRPCYGGNSVR